MRLRRWLRGPRAICRPGASGQQCAARRAIAADLPRVRLAAERAIRRAPAALRLPRPSCRRKCSVSSWGESQEQVLGDLLGDGRLDPLGELLPEHSHQLRRSNQHQAIEELPVEPLRSFRRQVLRKTMSSSLWRPWGSSSTFGPYLVPAFGNFRYSRRSQSCIRPSGCSTTSTGFHRPVSAWNPEQLRPRRIRDHGHRHLAHLPALLVHKMSRSVLAGSDQADSRWPEARCRTEHIPACGSALAPREPSRARSPLHGAMHSSRCSSSSVEAEGSPPTRRNTADGSMSNGRAVDQRRMREHHRPSLSAARRQLRTSATPWPCSRPRLHPSAGHAWAAPPASWG